MDQTGQHPDCEGSTAESEKEYLVSVVIVVHQIPVGIADVREKSGPKRKPLILDHWSPRDRDYSGNPWSRLPVVITALTALTAMLL